MEGQSRREKINEAVDGFCDQIAETVESNDMVVGCKEFEDQLEGLPYKYKNSSCAKVTQKLFEVARGKMSDEADQEVLDKLLVLVKNVQSELYDPCPRYMDAMFFPSEDNVEKLINYIGKAKKNLKICVFNFTNNNISKAILKSHNDGVAV